jgi:4a-hydroxytetrahydrobiopterin dehydratase
MGIDPRKHGRPKIVESERRMSSDRDRRDDVSGLMEEDAGRESVAEMSPVVSGRRDRVGALRSRGTRKHEDGERRAHSVRDVAPDGRSSPKAIRSVASLTHSNHLTSMRQKLSDLEIQRALGGLAGWARRGDALTKTFIFERFADGIAFVDRVAKVADEMDHHPDIDIRYTKITMMLSTHDAGGITSSDLKLAERIETVTT